MDILLLIQPSLKSGGNETILGG